MEYIIKASCSIALTYALYYVFARKITSFNFVRGYFYLSIGLSLLFPYFDDFISLFFKENTLIVPEFFTAIVNKPVLTETIGSTINENLVEKGNTKALFLDIIRLIYFLGVGFFSVRFLFGVKRILKMVFSNGIKKVNDDNLVLVENLKYPFSFFNLIFLDKSDFFINNDTSVMLQHERVHVKQWHSIDMIFFEVLSILFWFNPFVWFFRYSIKEVHEYLADEGLLKLKNYSPYEYVNLLLKQACGFNKYMPANNFNGSITKKRVQMITTIKNKKVYILVLIFTVSIIFALTLSENSYANNNKNPKSNFVNSNKENKDIEEKYDTIFASTLSENSYANNNKNPKSNFINSNKENKNIEEKYDTIKKNETITYPYFNGTNNIQESQLAFNEYIIENRVYPEELDDKMVSGNVIINYSIDENGEVYNVVCGNKSMKEFYQEKLKMYHEGQKEYMKLKVQLDKITDNPLLIEEALRLVKSFPVHVPSKNANGEPVKSEYNIATISFANPIAALRRSHSFGRYIRNNMNYPEEAVKAGIEGVVYLKYDLDQNFRYGNIELATQQMKEFYQRKGDLEMVNKITDNPILVKEAIRLLKEKPGDYIENFNSANRASVGMCNIDFFLPND